MRGTLDVVPVCVASLLLYSGAPATQQAPSPQFRAGVRLVPVEVRAVDPEGRPVTDLAASDFSIREDNRRQQIAHFERVIIDAGPSAGTGRAFLVVLGTGRLNEPAKALEALIDFARSQLMPADRIGIVVWLRYVELTNDHEAVARLLERFRDQHERVGGLIARDIAKNFGRAGRPGTVSQETDEAIDSILNDGSLEVGGLAGVDGGGGYQLQSSPRAVRDALLLARVIPGDKHVVVVTERVMPLGIQPPNLLDSYWVKLATGSRASLSFIHAGGLGSTSIGTGMYKGQLSPRGSVAGFWESTAIADQRRIAELTGGVASFFQFAREPLSAIDRMTRSHYLLGYYPVNQSEADRTRQIEVAVSRPGVRLVYRHAHVDAAPADGIESFRRAVTESMIELGARQALEPPPVLDKGMPRRTYLRVELADGASKESPLRLAVSFDPAWLPFVETRGGFASDIELALFADTAARELVGERRLRLKLDLNAADYERTRRQWVTFETSLPVTAVPRYIRAVAYDFEMDRLSFAQLRISR
jgi:VWFA-related protein